MPTRLVNASIDRKRYIEENAQVWSNGITGEEYSVPNNESANLTQCLRYIAARVDVPQRCISAVAPRTFVIHKFRGNHQPGIFPCGSPLWTTHCHICDDFYLRPIVGLQVVRSNVSANVANLYELDVERRELNCELCHIDMCRPCYTMCNPCIICQMENVPAYTPETSRAKLIHEAYTRTWNEHFPQTTDGQPINHDCFNYFPFVEATVVGDFCEEIN